MLAKVKLKCPECGTEFTKTKNCINKSEANDWEEYIKGLGLYCKQCYFEEQQKQTLQKAKVFKLPKLIGTEKQISYAESLRARYVVENEKDIKKITVTSEEDVAKQCQELGLETAVVVKVLFESDASTLIPYLKYN